MKEPVINITKDILRLVAELDEFKGEWKALGNLAPDRLKALKKLQQRKSRYSSRCIQGRIFQFNHHSPIHPFTYSPIQQLNDLTIQLINYSTIQLINYSTNQQTKFDK